MTHWQNLYRTSYLLALAVPAIKIFRHEASSPHNFILFPILAKSPRKVEGVTMNRSVLSLGVVVMCGLSRAPYCDVPPPALA